MEAAAQCRPHRDARKAPAAPALRRPRPLPWHQGAAGSSLRGTCKKNASDLWSWCWVLPPDDAKNLCLGKNKAVGLSSCILW